MSGRQTTSARYSGSASKGDPTTVPFNAFTMTDFGVPNKAKNGGDSVFTVGDHFGLEGGPKYPVGSKEYESTMRLNPPYPLTYNMLGLSIVEFLAMLFFCIPIFSAQALGASQAAVAIVKAVALFFVTYTFWHWGKVHVNVAVTLTSWMVGLSTAWELVARTLGQGLGMLAAVGISWGFFNADGGVGLTGYGYTYGVQWGWEIFFSFLVFSAYFWPIVTCKLREEMETRWRHKTDWDSTEIKTFFETHVATHLPDSKSVHAMADHSISLSYGFFYGIAAYVGSYVDGGIYNAWLWFPHAFNTSVEGNQKGLEFALYFFGPVVGAIAAGALLWLAIMLKRRSIIHTFDKAHLDNWTREVREGNYAPGYI